MFLYTVDCLPFKQMVESQKLYGVMLVPTYIMALMLMKVTFISITLVARKSWVLKQCPA